MMLEANNKIRNIEIKCKEIEEKLEEKQFELENI